MDISDSRLDTITDGKQLKRTMNPRHLLMISIGGTIGTGLFMGSSQTLSQAGPLGAILAYLLGGGIMYLVLLCLAELAVAMPVSGSFQAYASKYISPGAGFTTGWLYWFSWVTCIAADFTAAGMIMHHWFAQVPTWLWCGIFMAALTVLNMFSARAYGEAEFWFASIKIVAIIGFIIAGAGLIFGVAGPEGALGFSNFMSTPDLFPNGFSAVFITMLIVVCSFQGTELVGIAIGECKNPKTVVPKIIHGISLRIVVFYVLTIVVLAFTVPWSSTSILESPFAHMFSRIGIPIAEDIMQFVILTAALSAGNSALYACSRLLWSMSKEGMAPKYLAHLNEVGVPINGVFFTLAASGLTFLTYVFSPEKVYVWLMSSTGLTGCVIWIMIAWSQLNFRKDYLRKGGKLSKLSFKTPWYPLVPRLAIILNAIIIVSLYFDESQRIVLYTSLPIFTGVYLYHCLFMVKRQAVWKLQPKHR